MFALEKIIRRPSGDNFFTTFSTYVEGFPRSKQKLTLIRQTGGAVIVVCVIGIAIRTKIVHHYTHEMCARCARLPFTILALLPGRVASFDHQYGSVFYACQNPSVGDIQQ